MQTPPESTETPAREATEARFVEDGTGDTASGPQSCFSLFRWRQRWAASPQAPRRPCRPGTRPCACRRPASSRGDPALFLRSEPLPPALGGASGAGVCETPRETGPRGDRTPDPQYLREDGPEGHCAPVFSQHGGRNPAAGRLTLGFENPKEDTLPSDTGPRSAVSTKGRQQEGDGRCFSCSARLAFCEVLRPWALPIYIFSLW